MTYSTIPDLAIMLWMWVVLVRLCRKDTGHFLSLWSVALGLIVVEGIARIVYLNSERVGFVHSISHAIALNAYLLAGICFLLSSLGRSRLVARDILYFTLCSAPSVVLLTAYGLGCHSRLLYVMATLASITVTALAAAAFRRPATHVLFYAAVCLPLLFLAWNGLFRGAAYFLLFAIYAGTAVGFFLTLPHKHWGRRVVTTGFALWSLCFLSHPWLSELHTALYPILERVWDLQKFVITFGLLILALEETNTANEYDAMHDSLTALPNRRLLADRLAQDLARARRNGTRVLVFNIDIDSFKKINDNWGHEAGDFVLIEVARRLRKITREPDTISRVGGDEFYVVINDFKIPESSEPSLATILERSQVLIENFRASVETQPFILQRNEADIHFSVGLSIGCAVFPEQASDPVDLNRIADRSMYEDKRARAAHCPRHSGVQSAALPTGAASIRKSPTITQRIN
ncbi:MAG: GGDEF domain-containing protein [Bryocella sp.]